MSALAYLEFVERQPALYAVIFSARRPLTAGSSSVDRGEALDALIGAVAAATPDADDAEARAVALTFWAALHGYALLRDRTPVGSWPDREAYADRLLRAHLGA